jgi:hypothetical protein
MERPMKTPILAATALAALIAMPIAAQAQGTVRGAAEGADAGAHAAGPIGAVVGGTVGAVAGTVGGILGIDDRPQFREYVVKEHVPSYTYREPVHVGVVLPDEGVTYYEVPARFHVRHDYRYTVINGHAVLVEPQTRRVVEVID